MRSRKPSKGLACLFLILVMILASSTFAQVSDINDHWAKQQVTDWVNKGLASGYPDGTFRPDAEITRAEFVTLLNRAFSLTQSSPINFSDVFADDWFAAEVAIAKTAGYVGGYNDGTFRPDNPISRQEVASILSRYLQLSPTPNFSAAAQFKDEIPDWSRAAVDAVAFKQLMGGYPDQTFQPLNPITRAEAVVVLDRAVHLRPDIPAVVQSVFDKAGTYGPETGMTTITGDASIIVADVTLRNTTITGNLTLTAGIGEGNVTLQNVIVKGTTIVNGGGPHSVTLDGYEGLLEITKEGVRVVATGSTKILSTKVEAGAILVEADLDGDGFGDVTISKTLVSGAKVVLDGQFANVQISAADVAVEVAGGSVANLDIAANASGATINVARDAQIVALAANGAVTVQGQGTVTKATINSSSAVLAANFGRVDLVARDATLDIRGTVATLGIGSSAAGSRVIMAAEAKVTTLEANASAAVTGQGTIATAKINVVGVTIEKKPAQIVLADKVTTTVEGKPWPPVTGGGGGGLPVDNIPPVAPTQISAEAVSGSEIYVSWTPSTSNDVAGYHVYRDGTNVATVQDNRFNDTGRNYATAHTYYVVAYDRAGNVSAHSPSASAMTWAAGTLIVSGITDQAVVNHDVTIVASCAGQTVTMKIDNGQESSALGTYRQSITAPGPHTVVISATGGANSVTLHFTIDKTAPTVTIGGVPASLENDRNGVTPSIAYGGDYVDGTQKVLLNGKTYDGSPIIQPGQYTLTASAADAAGNVASESKTFAIIWDSAAPTINITGVQDGGVYESASPIIALTGGSNLAQYQYTATVTRPDNSTANFTNGDTLATAGRYSLTVVATNPSLVTVTSTKTVSFTIDKQAPVVTVANIVDGHSYNAFVAPLVQFSDDVASQSQLSSNATVTLTRNGTAVAYEPGDVLTADGSYILTVSTRDQFGHQSNEIVKSFTIDTVEPVITVSGALDGDTYKVPTEVTFAASEGTLVVKDGANQIQLTDGKYTFSGADGDVVDYALQITAQDTAGNVTTRQLTFSIDRLPIDVVVDGVISGQIFRQDPVIFFTTYVGDVEQVGATTATIDGAGFGGGVYGQEGRHTLEVRYQGVPKKTIPFTLDKTAPTVAIQSLLKNGAATVGDLYLKSGDQVKVSAAASDNLDLRELYFTVGDQLVRVPLTINGARYEGTWTVGGGNYTGLSLTVTAFDKAGNSAQAVFSGTVNIDNTAPAVTLQTTPETADGNNGIFKSPTMSITLTTGDQDTIVYTLNGTPGTALGSKNLTPLQGKNTLIYHAEDKAGNVSETSTKVFDYDSLSPQTPAITQPQSGLTTNLSSLTITGSGEVGPNLQVLVRKAGEQIAAGNLSNGSFTISGITLSEGDNSFTLVVQDYAGNESAPITFTRTLDSTAPIIAVNKIDATHYQATTNEVLTGVTATFNGANIDAGNPVNGVYTIATPSPVAGTNTMLFSGKDNAGNTGHGSLTINYIQPASEQQTLPVGNNATMEVAANSFSGPTQVTVKTGVVPGQSAYQALGAPLSFDFSRKPDNPVVVKLFAGVGLTGVTVFHITDAGVSEPMEVITTVSTAFDQNTAEVDHAYYLSDTGYVVIKTKNFSWWGLFRDKEAPVIHLPNWPVDRLNTVNCQDSLRGPIQISGFLTDNADTNPVISQVAIDQVPVTPLSSYVTTMGSNFTITLPLSEGWHSVSLAATDRSGNTSIPVWRMFWVDRVRPTLTVVTPPPITNNSFVFFPVAVSETSSLSMTVSGPDGAQSSSMYAGFSYLPKDGLYNFTVTAHDLMGNVGSRSFSVTRDTVGPVITVNGVEHEGRYGTAKTISVTANEGATPIVYLDNVPFMGGTVSVDGEHVLVASATDAVGNRTTKRVVFTINQKNPEINIEGVTDGATYNSDKNLTITAQNADELRVTRSINGGAEENLTVQGLTVTTSTNVANNQQATYVIRATATRTVGSVRRITTRMVTFTVDKDPHNANLKSLGVSAGVLSPAFDPSITSYTVNVGRDDRVVTLTPTTANRLATMKVNGNPVQSGQGVSINLQDGVNIVTIMVTAPDSTTIKSYVLNITKPIEIASVAASNYTYLDVLLSAVPSQPPTALSANVTRTINGALDTSFQWTGGVSRWDESRKILGLMTPYVSNADYQVTFNNTSVQVLDVTASIHTNLDVVLTGVPTPTPTLDSITVTRLVNGVADPAFQWPNSANSTMWNPISKTITVFNLPPVANDAPVPAVTYRAQYGTFEGTSNVVATVPVAISKVTAAYYTYVDLELSVAPAIRPTAMSVDVTRTIHGQPDASFAWHGGSSTWSPSRKTMSLQIPYVEGARYTATWRDSTDGVSIVSSTQRTLTHLDIKLTAASNGLPDIGQLVVSRSLDGQADPNPIVDPLCRYDPVQGSVIVMMLPIVTTDQWVQSTVYHVNWPGYGTKDAQALPSIIPDSSYYFVHSTPLMAQEGREATITGELMVNGEITNAHYKAKVATSTGQTLAESFTDDGHFVVVFTPSLADGQLELQWFALNSDLTESRKVWSHGITVSPTATVASSLPSNVNAGQEQSFTITTLANSDLNTPVRFRITLSNPTQKDNVVLKYRDSQDGTYYPLGFDQQGVAWYGPTNGFPLINATSQFRITFSAAGNYGYALDVVRVADGAALATAVQTVTVVPAVNDPTALLNAIADAQGKHNAATEGSNYGDHAPGSKQTLLTAIGAAQAVYDARATKTQAEIDAAVAQLQAAVTAFEASRVPVGPVSHFNGAPVNSYTITAPWNSVNSNTGIRVSKAASLNFEVEGLGSFGSYPLQADTDYSLMSTPLNMIAGTNLAAIDLDGIVDAMRTADTATKTAVLRAINFTQLVNTLRTHLGAGAQTAILGQVDLENIYLGLKEQGNATAREAILDNLQQVLGLVQANMNQLEAAKDPRAEAIKSIVLGVFMDLVGDGYGTQLYPILDNYRSGAYSGYAELFAALRALPEKVEILAAMDYNSLFDAARLLDDSTKTAIFSTVDLATLFEAVSNFSDSRKSILFSNVTSILSSLPDTPELRQGILGSFATVRSDLFTWLKGVDGSSAQLTITLHLVAGTQTSHYVINLN